MPDSAILPDNVVEVLVDGVPLKFTLAPTGEVTCDWWTPGAAEILCALCGKKEKENHEGKGLDLVDLFNPGNPCLHCLNKNPYCG